MGGCPPDRGWGVQVVAVPFLGVVAGSGSWWSRVIWVLVWLPWWCVVWVGFLAALVVGPWGPFFGGAPPSWIVGGWVLGLFGGWCACLWAPGEPAGLVGDSLWLSEVGGAVPWAGVWVLLGVCVPWP